MIRRFQFFARDKIPANVYPGIEPVDTVSVGAQWLVASSVESDLVYEITKTLWNGNSRRLLDNGHIKGRSIRIDSALDGIAVPLHPGAKRFYEENGVSTN